MEGEMQEMQELLQRADELTRAHLARDAALQARVEEARHQLGASRPDPLLVGGITIGLLILLALVLAEVFLAAVRRSAKRRVAARLATKDRGAAKTVVSLVVMEHGTARPAAPADLVYAGVADEPGGVLVALEDTSEHAEITRGALLAATRDDKPLVLVSPTKGRFDAGWADSLRTYQHDDRRGLTAHLLITSPIARKLIERSALLGVRYVRRAPDPVRTRALDWVVELHVDGPDADLVDLARAGHDVSPVLLQRHRLHRVRREQLVAEPSARNR